MRSPTGIFLSLLLLGILLFTTACSSAEEPTELVSIRLPMGYIADPQYAPFYVATERGYFAEAGFEVEFDYSFETDGVALVGANETPFALVSGEQVLLARAQGIPVVYVMEWFQKFPIAIVSLADAGISSPDELRGREVGIPGLFGASYVGYSGLASAANLSEEEVVLSEIGFNQVESLLTGQVDAVVAYVNNEPVQLTAQGAAINIIPVSDYVDLVANGIITNETYAAENPEQVRAFVGAVLRGLEDTLADPDAAFEISRAYVEGLDDSRRPILDASIAVWEADELGFSDIAAWQATEQTLIDMGFLNGPLDDLDAAFSNAYLP